MKLVDRGVVLCFVVLLKLAREGECADARAELHERRREKRAEEQEEKQTQTFRRREAAEQNGQNENPDPRTDSHR